MSRTPVKRRRKPALNRIGRKSGSATVRPCGQSSLFACLALCIGETLIGILRRSRRIRAANDPEA